MSAAHKAAISRGLRAYHAKHSRKRQKGKGTLHDLQSEETVKLPKALGGGTAKRVKSSDTQRAGARKRGGSVGIKNKRGSTMSFDGSSRIVRGKGGVAKLVNPRESVRKASTAKRKLRKRRARAKAK
jgi:hypothetical protein